MVLMVPCQGQAHVLSLAPGGTTNCPDINEASAGRTWSRSYQVIG